MADKMESYRRSIGLWRSATVVLVMLTLVLFIAILVILLDNKREMETPLVSYCAKHLVNLSEPGNPSVFHDLTKTEISALMKYLYSQPSLNLIHPSLATINSSYLYTTELYVPPKQEVLNFLDMGGPKPDRQAIVTIFRGDVNEPYVQELLIGPLTNPSYMKDVPGRRKNIPFIFRPFTGPEAVHMMEITKSVLHEKAAILLKESFGGSVKHCSAKCLIMRFPTPISSAISGESRRLIWLSMQQNVEFFGLHPVDFAVLVEVLGTQVILHQVWYNGQLFDNVSDLVQNYTAGKIQKIKMPFPDYSDNSYSKMKQKGTPFQESFEEEPIQVDPSGFRYSVQYNHVEYRGWSFDYRMSTTTGPQLFDIRYRGERIVYELSLQEIMVMYSGDKPSQMFSDYFESSALLGAHANGVVPGIDCPSHATFIDAFHVIEGRREPISSKHAFCLFEWNTGAPLRRHNSMNPANGGFYEGLPGVLLTLRTMITVLNYDYMVDFLFYQNGVIKIKVVSSGYIMSTTPSAGESDYGIKLHKYVNGNIHIHGFHFKVDIDIKGTANRYESLDIVQTSVPNPYFPKANSNYHMTKLERNLKTTELRASYKFDFDTPKYLIFYNNGSLNSYGNPKAYRIMSTGMAKQLFAEGKGNEPSASWARYQLAVTRHKELERQSSSMYAHMDANDPVVNFQKYLDDDETIVDQDLVAWVTLGTHHIPHTEDLPVTHTPGMDLSFYLLPFNYFPEDPSMASQHSVRLEYKDVSKPLQGIKVTRHVKRHKAKCLLPKSDFFEKLENL